MGAWTLWSEMQAVTRKQHYVPNWLLRRTIKSRLRQGTNRMFNQGTKPKLGNTTHRFRMYCHTQERLKITVFGHTCL